MASNSKSAWTNLLRRPRSQNQNPPRPRHSKSFLRRWRGRFAMRLRRAEALSLSAISTAFISATRPSFAPRSRARANCKPMPTALTFESAASKSSSPRVGSVARHHHRAALALLRRTRRRSRPRLAVHSRPSKTRSRENLSMKSSSAIFTSAQFLSERIFASATSRPATPACFYFLEPSAASMSSSSRTLFTKVKSSPAPSSAAKLLRAMSLTQGAFSAVRSCSPARLSRALAPAAASPFRR